MSTNNKAVLEQLQKARLPKKKEAPQKPKQRQPLPLPKKQIAKRSEKMKVVMSVLKPIYERYLSEHPYCELRTPVCVNQSSCIHQTAGRGLNKIADPSTYKAACGPCNDYVEAKDAEAREKKNKVTRHVKKDKK